MKGSRPPLAAAVVATTGEEVISAAVLRQWYCLDENATPAFYRLRAVGDVLGDFRSGDAARRNMAKQQWVLVRAKLQRTFYRFAHELYGREFAEDNFLGSGAFFSDVCFVKKHHLFSSYRR